MNNSNYIGMFDSGIGGVTVLSEILKILPDEKFIFYSDSINNPYGVKTQEEIIEICDNIVKKLLDKKVKAIVIACNTASANASEYLREKYSIPIIAIEPAYKMVNDFAKEEVTLVMATKGTLESKHFEELYSKYNNKKTYLLPCEGLANAIENNNTNLIMEILERELTPYKGKAKNIVLGCTHYPLVKNKISEILCDEEINFFNGAEGVARHLKEILEENDILNLQQANLKIDERIIFYDSSNTENKKSRFFEILNKG